MKHKKIIFLLLTVLLLLPMFGSLSAAAAGEQGTLLYHQDAPSTYAENMKVWPGNSSTGWAYTVNMDDGTSFPVFGYYNNRSAAGEGLPAGEFLEITIPDLALNTADFGEMELAFRYAVSGDDINVGMVDGLELFASTDGGKTWSKSYAEIKDNVFVGMAKINADDAWVYDVYTTDLAALVEEGQTINALKLRPFGNHPEHYMAFRLAWMEVRGYAGKLPVHAEKPETIQADGDTLRQVAVNQFYKQCLLPWIPAKMIETYNGGTDYGRTQWYTPGYLYYGPPYSRPARSTWQRFASSVNADGSLVDTYHYTDEDCEGGLDCIYTVWDGIALVTPAHANCWTYILKEKNNPVQMTGVLQEQTKIWGSRTPAATLDQFTEQEIYEAYAELGLGDMLLNGHAQMVTVAPTVVRREDGTIDPDRSSLKVTETAGTVMYYYMTPDGTIVESTTKELDKYAAANPTHKYLYGTSMRIDRRQTFAMMRNAPYIPATLTSYADGKLPAQKLNVVTHMTAQSIVKDGFYAAVESNWRMVKNVFTLTDKATGKVLFTQTEYPKVHYTSDYVNRVTSAELDAAIKGLSAGTYTVTLDVQSGPVIKIEGEPPMNRVLTLDFTVN
ncbi:MAG: hypothetical protein IJP02_04295 [Oscillospiraceae bacterium]|nr:hypothetical protein [Oscillospiraceae bacterium]